MKQITGKIYPKSISGGHKNMNKKETKQYIESLANLYAGILFNYQTFDEGKECEIEYDFNCPEYKELIQKYGIDVIAGKGSDFQRAIRLLKYLSPRLKHDTYFDNRIECNSLKLLEYSSNNNEHGINCLNKSKVLVECCLALGIYARRVVIMPFSPYDFDNHVVTEIYDRKRQKWFMLDPTTNGYFVNKEKEPLSMFEIREHFANRTFVTYVNASKPVRNINKAKEKYARQNIYLMKNSFYFVLDSYNGFGDKGKALYFVPKSYSTLENEKANTQYRLDNMPKDLLGEYGKFFEEKKEILSKASELPHQNIAAILCSPVKN